MRLWQVAKLELFPGTRQTHRGTDCEPWRCLRGATTSASTSIPRKPIGSSPGAVPHAERTVYILDPAAAGAGSCPLSKREHEIVALLADGWAALNIAARLNLSHATVRNHIQNALRKLEVHSQVEIVALALRSGWVDRREPRWNAASFTSPRSAVEAMAAGV